MAVSRNALKRYFFEEVSHVIRGLTEKSISAAVSRNALKYEFLKDVSDVIKGLSEKDVFLWQSPGTH